MSEHTKLPKLRQGLVYRRVFIEIVPEKEDSVASTVVATANECLPMWEKCLRSIVEACNSHQSNVELIEKLVETIKHYQLTTDTGCYCESGSKCIDCRFAEVLAEAKEQGFGGE